ncbi:MAG: ribosome maturation factor RimP [Actinomycetota bacterium]|nr:ribosome maturation factor RimP [Actinomycetota bacterium]
MSSRTPTAEVARITAVLQPVVAAFGCDLEEVAVSSVGRSTLVRLVVDGDGGVSLDLIADLSRAASSALDDAEAGGAFAAVSYTLEVSSPGVDRPLRQPRHWRRAVGRLVRTRVDGAALEGRIVSADEAGVVLDVAGSSQQVAYSALGRGSVQVEFSRPAEGGS